MSDRISSFDAAFKRLEKKGSEDYPDPAPAPIHIIQLGPRDGYPEESPFNKSIEVDATVLKHYARPPKVYSRSSNINVKTVVLNDGRERYSAQFRFEGQTFYTGTWSTPEEARGRYVEMHKEIVGIMSPFWQDNPFEKHVPFNPDKFLEPFVPDEQLMNIINARVSYESSNGRISGKDIVCETVDKRIRVCIDELIYLAGHNLAWYMHTCSWPKLGSTIRAISGDYTDLSFNNLAPTIS